MDLYYATTFHAVTTTRQGSQTGSDSINFPLSNTNKRGANPLLQSWRSTDLAQQQFQIDFTALIDPLILLLNVNWQQATIVHIGSGFSAQTQSSTLDTVTARRYALLPLDLGTCSSIQFTIPSGTPPSGQQFFEIGTVVVVDKINLRPIPQGMITGADIEVRNSTLISGQSASDLVDGDTIRVLSFQSESEYDNNDDDDALRALLGISPATDILLLDRDDSGVFSPLLGRRNRPTENMSLHSLRGDVSMSIQERA